MAFSVRAGWPGLADFNLLSAAVAFDFDFCPSSAGPSVSFDAKLLSLPPLPPLPPSL